MIRETLFTVAAILLKNASMGSAGGSACLSLSLLQNISLVMRMPSQVDI